MKSRTMVITTVILAIPAVRHAWVSLAAGLSNLILNIIHVTNEGIGTLA